MTREELIQSKEYVVAGLQLNLLNFIEDYMKTNKLNREKLAKQLGVSKGYVSQVLNASYDHKLSKVVDLSLSCNAVPLLFFVNKEEYIANDAEDKIYELMPMQRPRNVTFDSQMSMNSLSYSKIQTITSGSFKHPVIDWNKLKPVSGSSQSENFNITG